MPDENRFSGIGEAMGDEKADGEESDEEAAGDVPADEGTNVADADASAESDSASSAAPDAESGTEAPEATDLDTGSGTDEEDVAADDGDSAEAAPLDSPAFAFEETGAKSLYLRPPTVETLDDTEFEVEAALRSDYDVRNLTGREFHDAAVRVLAEHADEIAERVVEAREE